MALLEVRSLTRRPWFEDYGLELQAGEIVVLSGPTGSGKTLLLRTIADLDEGDAGVVLLNGESRDEVPAPIWRRQVLYVHQSGVRLPGTVRENLARIAEVVGVPESPAADLDVDADADRLSGGERQALALGRAFLCEPRILLLDESTSAMDAETASLWERRLRARVKAGLGIIWVTHDAGLAKRMGARVEAFP